jgi:hypothetical protein
MSDEKYGSLPFGLDQCSGRQISLQHIPHRCLLDKRQLYAEANDNADDETADKALKGAQALHGPVRPVEDENDHDVQDGQRTAGHQRQRREQQVQCDRRANNLAKCACQKTVPSAGHVYQKGKGGESKAKQKERGGSLTSAISVAIMAISARA